MSGIAAFLVIHLALVAIVPRTLRAMLTGGRDDQAKTKPPVQRSASSWTGLQRLQRRLFLRGGLSLGAVALLTGCNLEDDDAADRLLFAMSRWNDKVQAALFSKTRLAPVYDESEITDPFPFNAYYEEAHAPVVDAKTYRLEVGGLVEHRAPWTLERLDFGRRRIRYGIQSAAEAGTGPRSWSATVAPAEAAPRRPPKPTPKLGFSRHIPAQ
jgi:hypothetical protein